MIIKDKIYINILELKNNVSTLCQEFTYKNPEYLEKKRLKFSTKNVDEYLFHYTIETIHGNQMLIIPRGGLKKVLDFIEKKQLSVKVVDRRIEHAIIDVKLVKTKLEEQQKKIIKVLEDNEGGLVEASPGCLSGDTIININRGGNSRKYTLKKAYKRFHQLKNKYFNWDLSIPTYTRSYKADENVIKLHEVENIVYSGKKEVYKLELENDFVLKGTLDHKIMTRSGWLEIKKLKINKDEVMCDTIKSKKDTTKLKACKKIDKEVYNIPYHPYAIKKKARKKYTNRISLHRVIYEAYINAISLEEFLFILKYDKEKSKILKYIDPLIYDIHHKDFNHYNNDITNLECLTKNKHQKLHSEKNQYNFNQGVPIYSKVKSIEYVGIEDTYDIICKELYHNFVANGIVVHNSGKTISILGLIAKIKQPTLIIVHEHRLSSQWMDEIKKRLSGNFTVGKIDGDKKIDGDIVVGIINSLHKRFQANPDYFNKFGMIVHDECHKSPAPMFMKLLNNLSARYRIGVTGTVKSKDGRHILTLDIFGNILIQIDAGDIKHRITNFDYRIINTNISFEIPTTMRWNGKKREQAIDSAACIKKLTEDQDRNNIIIEKIIECINQGYYPLVLSERIEHNKNLHQHLTELGYKAVLLIGETRKKTNWGEIREDKSIQCIIANTKIASEGLDLPRLSALFLLVFSSNLPKIKQRIGRIRRQCEGKPLPLVFDICDNLAYFINDANERINLLQILAYKRLRFYKQLQKEYMINGDTEENLV